MKPSALPFILAECLLAVNVLLWAYRGMPWGALGWAVAIYVTWRSYRSLES